MFCNDDNTTKGGEFIPTAFNWETLDGQKEKAKKLANITKEKNSKKQKKEDKARKNQKIKNK